MAKNGFPAVSRQRIDRPAWWTPEEVLSRLQSGQMASEVCLDAAKDCELTPHTLREDIQAWKESLTWGEQFTKALSIWRQARVNTPARISEDWWDEFFDAVVACEGRVMEACLQVGVGIEVVEALRDKRNKVYSPKFAEKLRIAESVRIARIRENVLNKGEHDGKLGLKILESSMPSLHSARQVVEHTGDINHRHQHEFKLDPQVAAAAQARFRALTVNREALPSGEQATVEVVEGEVVKETVGVANGA